MALAIPTPLPLPVSFLHPLLMWVLLGLSIQAMVLGIKAKKTRTASAEERKDLIKGQFARRHFQSRRKHIGCTPSREAAREHGLMQKEQKIGIHTDEMREKQKEIAREWMRKRGEENNHPGTRDWVITSKETGGEFVIRNLTAFCREHSINYRNLHFTAVSNYWAKGYRARKFDPLTDGDIPSREEYEQGLDG